MSRGFRYGTPSAEEWKGPWKAAPEDPEFNESDEATAELLTGEVDRLRPPGVSEDEFYLRGDFYIPDRTDYLEDALTWIVTEMEKRAGD